MRLSEWVAKWFFGWCRGLLSHERVAITYTLMCVLWKKNALLVLLSHCCSSFLCLYAQFSFSYPIFSLANHPLVFNWNSLVVFFFRFGILCHTNFGGWNGNLNNFKIYWTVRSNKANMLGTFIHIHIRYNILWINDCNECVDVLLLLLLLAFIFAHHIVFNMHCSLWSEYSSTLLRTHTCTCTEFKY